MKFGIMLIFVNSCVLTTNFVLKGMWQTYCRWWSR